MSEKIHTCAELTEYVDEIGFLPLLDMGIDGWSAEAVTDEDCQYTVLPDGGWEWPLWQWKGPVIRESGCAYGKFFNGKAALSAAAGGRISVTAGVVLLLVPRRAASTTPLGKF